MIIDVSVRAARDAAGHMGVSDRLVALPFRRARHGSVLSDRR
jgi:hypothetical protein